MSDYQDDYSCSSSKSRATKLFVCLFSERQHLNDLMVHLLNGDRYELKCLSVIQDFERFIRDNREQIDCLVLATNNSLNSIVARLWQWEILLPTIVVEVEQVIAKPIDTQTNSAISLKDLIARTIYHQAELHLYPTQLTEINSYINLAIAKFINLTPKAKNGRNLSQGELTKPEMEKSLKTQQRRLTKKIKQRLSSLGVHDRRDPKVFYHNLCSAKQEELYIQLNSSYRQIVIGYFNDNARVDKLVDEFVDLAFFADISTSQILEIHMELIDDFSQQLKIEGRSSDILLDCRLPLIDVISHLCEMYRRRSISKKDFSFELLFAVE